MAHSADQRANCLLCGELGDECSTINFEPTKTRNNLAISVTIDTPDFESLDLRFRLRVPSNTYQMQAWGL